MKLIRGEAVVDVFDENVISAFKEAGYVEAPEKAEAPEIKPKKRSTKSNN